jgi:AcrR family transcriptional regulator
VSAQNNVHFFEISSYNVKMPNRNTSKPAEPVQERASKTIEDILETATLITDEGAIELLNARNLSAKSGYSVGTIYRYFEKIDFVFLKLFDLRRKNAVKKLCNMMDAHNPHQDISILISNLVNLGITEWSTKSPQIIRHIIRYFFKHAQEPEKFNTVLDELIPHYVAAQSRDKTDTFRLMSDNCLRLQLRALQMAVRTPFWEGDTFAGSEEHRQCAIDMGIRLLSKQAI